MKLRSARRHLRGLIVVAAIALNAIALSLILVACGGEEVVEEVQETVEWSYSGEGGPANWASLSPRQRTMRQRNATIADQRYRLPRRKPFAAVVILVPQRS